MKAQQLDVILCNRIGVVKASTQDTAEHHFEIEKKGEYFGVKEMLKKMYMIDFNEPSLRSDHPIIGKLEGISYEDRRFLRIIEKETCKMGNHDQIPLPLRDEKMSLPKNRSATEKRLMYLKKRFQRDPKFHGDYKKFMEEIISKGYAKELQATPKDVREWYLRHHRVYYPNLSGKIRVVFDLGLNSAVDLSTKSYS